MNFQSVHGQSESGICARLRRPDMKPRHIGIVACSAEGAALCYKTICVEGAQLLGPHAHPEVSMHTPSLADYVACLERGDRQGVADLRSEERRVGKECRSRWSPCQ